MSERSRGKIWQGLWRLCNLLYWPALVLHLLVTVGLWQYTVEYDYWCGTPLMTAWSKWFMEAVLVGVLLVPGGIWVAEHKGKRSRIVYSAGFLLFIASVLLTLLVGKIWDVML